MPRLSDTREQIMDRAGQLLMQRGFHGFSYRDISSHLGVKNAAVHYHFPSKSDLALALVEEYRQMLRTRTAEFMANGGEAKTQLDGLFAFTAHQCSQGYCICPFGAFSVDYQDLPGEVREATRKFLDESVAWLSHVLDTGRKQSEFSFRGDAEARAVTILAALQGARQMGRISDSAGLERVFESIRADLEIKT